MPNSETGDTGERRPLCASYSSLKTHREAYTRYTHREAYPVTHAGRHTRVYTTYTGIQGSIYRGIHREAYTEVYTGRHTRVVYTSS